MPNKIKIKLKENTEYKQYDIFDFYKQCANNIKDSIKMSKKRKLNEDNEFEYLDTENPYKTHYDSALGGVSTVGVVDGDSSETKSPITMKTVRNQYWMDRSLGYGAGRYSMITSKDKLGESIKVLEYLTERDVIVVPSEEPPMEEDPNMEMGGEEEIPMEEDPNMGMEEEMPMEEEDPNIAALMDILQQSADPDTIEAVKKYAEGIIKAKGGDQEMGMEEEMPMEEDPNMGMEEEMPMEEDPNAAPPPQQQTESRKYDLDEIINDYFNDSDRNYVPTVPKNIGSGGNNSLRSKMFNPLQ